MSAKRESWSGRVGFILANIAAAVGLGSINIPTGAKPAAALSSCSTSSGSGYVMPLMLAELVLGRRGRSDAIRSILKVAEASNASARWGWSAASASPPGS